MLKVQILILILFHFNMKECTKCNALKPLSAFYKDKRMTSGLTCWCKPCVSDHLQLARKLKREKFTEIESSEKRKAHHHRKNENYRKNFPYKVSCHQKIFHAIRKGLLIKLPCVKCGNQKSSAHHNDYTKPLDVIWLCHTCHMDLHRSLVFNEDEKRYYDK